MWNRVVEQLGRDHRAGGHDGRVRRETFPNPAPHRDYVVAHSHHEFTSMCPITGHPDFATITVRFVPDKICVELKSLKLYFHAFRNEGIFFEAVTNKICDDLGKFLLDIFGSLRLPAKAGQYMSGAFEVALLDIISWRFRQEE